MGFYESNLVVFVIIISCLGYFQHQQRAAAAKSDELLGESTDELQSDATAKALHWQFKKTFLPVYLLVFAADWLQGPYIYTMYKDQKGLPEATVAYLFTTGFFSAAISASFVGDLADRYGRRAACLFFCVAYSLSCLSVLFDDIIVLFLGRILGGLSTTLMYSVFETWMVTEYHQQHLDSIGGSLTEIFGLMTTLNGVVAIVAGLFAQAVVDFIGTQKAPFMAAVISLMMAFSYISKHWTENFGDAAGKETLVDSFSEKESNGFRHIANDKRLWALCLTSCAFEGSMYLWIFFKFPALKLSREESGNPDELPFGTIFAVLMCGMMLGSLFFIYLSSLKKSQWPISSSTLLWATLSVASFCFLVPVVTHNEAITFWCFCVFEICCGVYFPSIANLKERIVEDGVRAKIYGIMRVPLNVFVVVGLMLTQDGLRHRENVFMCCAASLITASAALGSFVRE